MRQDGRIEIMTAQYWAKLEIQLELEIEDDNDDVVALANALGQFIDEWFGGKR